MRQLPLIVALLATSPAGFGGDAETSATGIPDPELVLTLRPGFSLSVLELADVDGRPGEDVVLVGTAGEAVAYTHAGTADDGGAFELVSGEPRMLPDPGRTIVDLAPLIAQDGPSQLLAASPTGLVLHEFADGAFGAGETVARRARFPLRVGRPRRVEFAQDVNDDGRLDVVLPGMSTCSLWMNADEDGRPRLSKAAEIAVDVQHSAARQDRALSDTLSSGFSVPRLRTRDVNGDGLADLVVTDHDLRAFHLQREDGVIPPEPDVSIDISIFRDTTPRADIAPGRTLAMGDSTRYETRDLDKDGIPDYVLAHRRKVWVFHGNEQGPQFAEPSTVLKAAEDVTAIVVARLDDDDYPDLLIFKVQIPSIATLIKGLFGEWEIEISAAGYRNTGERTFDTAPAWKGRVAIRLPSILSLIKDPEELVERMRSIEREWRPLEIGDVDGDGDEDVLLVSPDGLTLDCWLGEGTDADEAAQSADRLLREVFFENEDQVWDLDRIFGFVSSLARRRVARLTDGRAPDAQISLRGADAFKLIRLQAADVDGTPGEEVVVRYGRTDAPGSAVIDFWRVRAR